MTPIKGHSWSVPFGPLSFFCTPGIVNLNLETSAEVRGSIVDQPEVSASQVANRREPSGVTGPVRFESIPDLNVYRNGAWKYSRRTEFDCHAIPDWLDFLRGISNEIQVVAGP